MVYSDERLQAENRQALLYFIIDYEIRSSLWMPNIRIKWLREYLAKRTARIVMDKFARYEKNKSVSDAIKKYNLRIQELKDQKKDWDEALHKPGPHGETTTPN